jgi:hypothetical protein
MTPFNGSLAKNVSLVADQIIQAQLDTFLQDTSRAVDITPPDLRTVQCLSSPTLTRTVPCKRTYFMAGVEFTPSAMDNYTGLTNTQVILARNQQSYILDYEEQPGDEVFKDTDCQAYGFPFAGFNLCMRNDADNVLDARKSLLSTLTEILVLRYPRDCAMPAGNNSKVSLLRRHLMAQTSGVAYATHDPFPTCNGCIQSVKRLDSILGVHVVSLKACPRCRAAYAASLP